MEISVGDFTKTKSRRPPDPAPPSWYTPKSLDSSHKDPCTKTWVYCITVHNSQDGASAQKSIHIRMSHLHNGILFIHKEDIIMCWEMDRTGNHIVKQNKAELEKKSILNLMYIS